MTSDIERKMKDSSISWIDKIPEKWTTSPLKYVTSCLDGKRVPVDSAKRKTGQYPYWGAGNIVDHVDDYIFDEELVLLGEDGAPFFDKTRPVAFHVNEKIWVNNHIHVLKPKNIDASYLTYALNTVDYHEYIFGSIIPKLTQSDMDTIRIPIPSLSEQKIISSFLNKKCEKIESFINLQLDIISKLEEYKNSIISEAVTKGIDSSVQLVESNIPWIGKIPADWNCKKLKHVFNVYNGSTPKSEMREYWDGDIVWVTPADMNISGKYVTEGNKNITQCGFNSANLTLISKGDIVLSCRAPIGSIKLAGCPMCTNQGCKSLVPHMTVDTQYYYYYLSIQSEVLNQLGRGTTFMELSTEDLKEFQLPVPSIYEQHKIVEYLNKCCDKLDQLIAYRNEAISRLQEYKNSSIYEYVTGKKYVLEV